MDVSSKPGDIYFESEAGAYYNYAKGVGGSSESQQDGLKVEITKGNETQDVLLGNQNLTVSQGNRVREVGLNETVKITGIQKITAKKLFLN